MSLNRPQTNDAGTRITEMDVNIRILTKGKKRDKPKNKKRLSIFRFFAKEE